MIPSAERARPDRPFDDERWWRCRVIVYVLVGLFAVDVAVAAYRDLWIAYDPDDYVERLNGCLREAHDLVVVGGSSVSEGIDPSRLIGLRWRGEPVTRPYNLGLPGATASEVWHAVKHGLAKPPRVLVYAVTASDLNDNREEPHGPQSLMDAGDVLVWLQSSPASAEWVVRKFVEGRTANLWSLFRYRNGIRLWAAAAASGVWPGLCPEVAAEAAARLRYTAAMRGGNGFAPRPDFQNGRFDQVKAAGAAPTRMNFLDHFRIGGGHLSYIHRMLDWAAAAGVDVVLVDMPVSVDLEQRLYPDAFATYRRTLTEVAQAHRVRMLTASRDAVGLGDADFGDLIHLNAQGVPRLSIWLRRALEGIS